MGDAALLPGYVYRAGLCAGFVRNQRQQVGDADIDAGLEQQRAGLAAMVGLVIEEVHQQCTETFLRRYAFHVRVMQHVLQVGVGQLGDPLPDGGVQSLTMRAQRGQVGKQDLVQ